VRLFLVNVHLLDVPVIREDRTRQGVQQELGHAIQVLVVDASRLKAPHRHFQWDGGGGSVRIGIANIRRQQPWPP
jgi:hypothetical protein